LGFGLWSLIFALVAFLIAPALFPGFAANQPVIRGKIANFRVVPEYYPAPRQTQMKSLLQGAEAEPQPDRRVLVKGVKLQTFLENGGTELVVDAPQCVYDTAARVASSGGPLRAQAAEGKFTIEGEGFRWEQTNSTLMISNRVRTFADAAILNPSASATAGEASPGLSGPIEIFSDSFEYAKESGLGIYRGNVRVAGTNLTVTAGVLTVELPMGERRLRGFTAEREVALSYSGVRATGERVAYAAESDVARVTGHPTWQAEQGRGGGDELLIDRSNRIFRVTGNASFQMPGGNLGSSGLLGGRMGESASAATPGDHVIEVLCRDYEFRTNAASFNQDVRVAERMGGEVRGKMNCGRMNISFVGTNQVEQLVAEEKVVIEQEDKQFTGGRAVYTAADGRLDLLEEPTWRAGGRMGKGDVLRANLRADQMSALGNAWMRLPAGDLGELKGRFAPAAAREATPPAAIASQVADVFCEQYTATPTQAVFQGAVRILHPQMDWSCGRVTVDFPPKGGRAEQLLAEEKVIFELTDSNGRKLRGNGNQAVYHLGVAGGGTNEFVRLTGDPARLETTNSYSRNKIFVVDLATHKIMAPGKYSISGSTNIAARGTSLFPESRKKQK
jgi:lipopolysaccharide export system protein LptA